MSKLEKAKDRILKEPKDYTYTEARSLLSQLGYEEFTKGKTSGSRVKFYNAKSKHSILLHKPHPGDVMKSYAVRDLKQNLLDVGVLK